MYVLIQVNSSEQIDRRISVRNFNGLLPFVRYGDKNLQNDL